MKRKGATTIPAFPTDQITKKLVGLALSEDLPHGDVTTTLALTKKVQGRADLLFKQRAVVCGVPLIKEIFSQLHAKVKIEILHGEGSIVAPQTVVARVFGAVPDLLCAERTLLNFVQRLSGVATYTRNVVSRAHGFSVLDTRKTTPGFRALEKYAVRCGGGVNHRANLSEMILVKNNHVDGGGGMRAVLARIYANKPEKIKVEVEVRDLKELRDALGFSPEFIMLDNMNDREVVQAMKLIKAHPRPPKVEVSGGVEVKRFKAIAKFGVDFVSMGALTTQATNVDVSLRIQRI